MDHRDISTIEDSKCAVRVAETATSDVQMELGTVREEGTENIPYESFLPSFLTSVYISTFVCFPGVTTHCSCTRIFAAQ